MWCLFTINQKTANNKEKGEFIPFNNDNKENGDEKSLREKKK